MLNCHLGPENPQYITMESLHLTATELYGYRIVQAEVDQFGRTDTPFFQLPLGHFATTERHRFFRYFSGVFQVDRGGPAWLNQG